MVAGAFSAQGLHFRPWRVTDAQDMVRLFDTEEMNRWTPLPHPFTVEVAADYVRRAGEGLGGVFQFAVCEDVEGAPVGEVLLFPALERETIEVAYAVGAEHRGRNIGARAVLAALELATLGGNQRALLTIAEDNQASQATARAAGFIKTDAPLRRRERKRFVLMMQTWERSLAARRR